MASRRKTFVSHSTPSQLDSKLLADLPRVFIDRSLGAVQVPTHLRAAGLVLTTMREHYGEQQAQSVQDVDWITLVAQRNWMGFHKDGDIRRNVVERQTVIGVAARMFCIANAEITAQDAANRYIANFHAIAAAALGPAPFIYSNSSAPDRATLVRVTAPPRKSLRVHHHRPPNSA